MFKLWNMWRMVFLSWIWLSTVKLQSLILNLGEIFGLIHFCPCMYLELYLTWYSLGTTSCGCQINKVKICNICIIEKANLFEILWKYKEGISTLLFFNLTETCLRRILKAYPRISNKRKTCANWFLTSFLLKITAKTYQQ